MKSKKSLKDVTFLVRVKIDSMDRLENLLMVIDFLTTHFETNIHVLEVGNYNNNIIRELLPEDISVSFIEDFDPVYHQTRYLNVMAKNTKTLYLSVWDADVIVHPEQISQSVDLLRKDKFDFVSPYKGIALDTTGIIKELYFKKRDIDILIENKNKMALTRYPNLSVGGGIFAKTEAYIHAGMENEYFYGWGGEDEERILRWVILGYRFTRLEGILFHFTHKRGLNSRYYSDSREDNALLEVFRILSMSENELKNEIKSWNQQ